MAGTDGLRYGRSLTHEADERALPAYTSSPEYPSEPRLTHKAGERALQEDLARPRQGLKDHQVSPTRPVSGRCRVTSSGVQVLTANVNHTSATMRLLYVLAPG